MKFLSLNEANVATVWCVITTIAWDESRGWFGFRMQRLLGNSLSPS